MDPGIQQTRVCHDRVEDVLLISKQGWDGNTKTRGRVRLPFDCSKVAMILSLILAGSVFAGHIETPAAPAPPPTPTASTTTIVLLILNVIYR